MSPRIDGLIVSAKALYSRLSGWQRIGIVIALGVLVFVFLGTIGVKQSPPRTKLSGFKPYRPERPVLVKRNIAGLGGGTKEGEFPRPPGPGVEVSILEEIKSLKSQLEELRSLVVNSSESAGTPDKGAEAECRIARPCILLRARSWSLSSSLLFTNRERILHGARLAPWSSVAAASASPVNRVGADAAALQGPWTAPEPRTRLSSLLSPPSGGGIENKRSHGSFIYSAPTTEGLPV